MQNHNDDLLIKQLLHDVRIIAVVGLSPKSNRPSHKVAQYLQRFSYKIVPVRPAISEVLGEKAYNVLEDIPFKVDLVNVFRASQYVNEIVNSCINLGINKIWLQEGVIDNSAKANANKAGISMIMDRCIYKEILRLDIKQSDKQ